MADRLFVYGTLRRDAPNSRSSILGPDAEFAGYARMAGHLLDLGHFPGFVPGNCRPRGGGPARESSVAGEGPWVRGELYTLRNPARTLPRLDRYEGCGPDDPKPHLFERVVRTAIRRPDTEDRRDRGDHENEDRERGDHENEDVEKEQAWVYVYRGPAIEGARIPSGDYARYRG